MFRSNKIVTILSIDGGGVRGIIPIKILEALSKILSEEGINRPFYSLFDIISGTSTGGIIALALASPEPNEPLPIKDLLMFYMKNSKYVFQASEPTTYKVLKSLYQPPIDPTNFEHQLASYFNNRTLKDLKAYTYISSVEVTNLTPVTFTRLKPSDSNDHNYYLKDVARATSSEPSLFPPARIKSTNGVSNHCLLDGGFYAPNPCIDTYLYAKTLYPNASKYVILSLGTGDPFEGYNCNKVSKWGIFGWISPKSDIPLVQIFMRPQVKNASNLTRLQNDTTFYRLNPTIPRDIASLSDSSDKNIKALEDFGQDYSQNMLSTLRKVAAYLKHK